MVAGAVCLAAVLVVQAQVPDRPAEADEAPRSAAPPTATAASPPASPASGILQEWDRARAAAWASGDVTALDRLYVEGSAAGEADVALLQRYRERGLTVRNMSMQVLALRVHDHSRRRLVIDVTDRLVGAVAEGAQGTRDLPRDQPTARRLTLERVDGSWLMASVEAQPESPAPSTEAMSSSRKS